MFSYTSTSYYRVTTVTALMTWFDLLVWSRSAIEPLSDTKKRIHHYGVDVHAKPDHLPKTYIFKSNSQVTYTYFLFDPHNFGIRGPPVDSQSSNSSGQCRNNNCLLMQDCCSLVLYSRDELDQIEWDLLFSLTHHLSNNWLSKSAASC